MTADVRSPRSRGNGPGAGSEATPLDAPTAAAGVLEAVHGGESVALLVVVHDPTGDRRGHRVLVSHTWARGTLGSPEADRAAHTVARRALEGEGAEEGMVELDMDEDEPLGVYMEIHHPQPEFVVVGAGHIAQPLATLGSILGCRVFVLDDRPEFATRERFPEAERVVKVSFDDPFSEVPIRRHSHLVLVTRGHKYDYECLRRVLREDPLPAYIGMIGSRRRVRATWAQLMEEGIPRERIARVRAPVGLDLGAETPGEIAVAVAAEIVEMWRGGTGKPLREEERVLERFFESGKDEGPGRAEHTKSTNEVGRADEEHEVKTP
ncbi:MAG: XdhC family protein [Longimicrobiales bacterium]